MKILTEEDVKFKGDEHYYSLKRYFNRKFIIDWYEEKFRPAKSIGYVMQLMERFAPTSSEEAYRLYIESGFNEKDRELEDRGRDYDEIEEMAIEWKTLTNDSHPLVDFYDTLVLHAVIETYDGYIKEKAVKDALLTNGYEVSKPSGKDDSELGIDLIAKKNIDTFLIQVKPHSFFYRTKKGDLIKDRKRVWRAQEKGLKEYGPRAWYRYYIYDNNTKMWVLNKDGKCGFAYEDLVDKNGNVLVNISEMCKHEVDSLS